MRTAPLLALPLPVVTWRIADVLARVYFGVNRPRLPIGGLYAYTGLGIAPRNDRRVGIRRDDTSAMFASALNPIVGPDGERNVRPQVAEGVRRHRDCLTREESAWHPHRYPLFDDALSSRKEGP